MIQRPFSDSLQGSTNSQIKDYLISPGYSQVNTIDHKRQRPISTVISSIDIGHGILNKPTYSRIKISKNNNQNEQRLTRNTFANKTDAFLPNKDNVLFADHDSQFTVNNSSQSDEILAEINKIPSIPFFASVKTIADHTNLDGSFWINSSIANENNIHTTSIYNNHRAENESTFPDTAYEMDPDKQEIWKQDGPSLSPVNLTTLKNCAKLLQYKVDFDVQEKFLHMDIEVILVPRTHVDTIWLKPFESLHNDTVQKIITNVIKKLQFYPNLTFTWNEISHLSQWWKNASQKRRVTLRRLIREGRLEITTGGWVETDEAMSSLYGILHQFIEGHQWLDQYLNYTPEVAWITNSVTHSPTVTYILSAIGITNLVMTNVHFSLEQYFAEYQYSDFIWVQNWDSDKTTRTDLNQALNKIGNDQYPKHAVLTHYLQYNSDSFKACGPYGKVCEVEFNFANKIIDINEYNVKNKAETLLEQYSKTGTLSPHNIIIAPVGGPLHYVSQTEFDYQYNNYLNIANFINVNQNIYKATVQFGTPTDYFTAIMARHKSYPTLSGDFLNYAEIDKTRPVYWTGFFTTRPSLKLLLRRLQATLRSTEFLFSFTSSCTAFRTTNKTQLITKLTNAREIVARLQDRNVISGTLSSKMLSYVQNQILIAVKDCWYIQEVTASLLSTKPEHSEKYLTKYVYRDGEFISSFKCIEPGDKIYVFNSLNHEVTEIVELLTRHVNTRVIDYNKKDINFQINPVWKYSSADNVIRISSQFFKIIFAVKVPPMTLKLFQFKEAFDVSLSTSIIFCLACVMDSAVNNPFTVQPIEPGDVQIENYNVRLIFDEVDGLLKTIIEKETNDERQLVINYGAFKSSDINAGIYLFSTSAQRFQDILKEYRADSKRKMLIIVSGNVVTEYTSIYGNLLKHTVRICNEMNNPLAGVVRIESNLNFGVAPKNRDLEMFMTIQTCIENGKSPILYLDNNGFRVTSRKLNISRKVEANMYPMTSMAFIQDDKTRLTIITDRAQGVTALQEGQILIMLDRRILFNDKRGVNEGLSDNSPYNHIHYMLLENFAKEDISFDKTLNEQIVLPSLLANRIANSLLFPLDIFFVDKNYIDMPYYVFLPLIRGSFPCDVCVLSFRMILRKGLGFKNVLDTAIITLHRKSFTCKFFVHNNLYCKDDESFYIERIIQHVKQVFHTNLVGTTKGVPIFDINVNNLPPMELMSLKVVFETT
ncbi:unnamed protein product [Leptosia nina]|uniref:Alpha-mannosidase n=1 Tax=Leptosia nina TaxID=320188 RepID=A0AAV1K2X7_9NEOP